MRSDKKRRISKAALATTAARPPRERLALAAAPDGARRGSQAPRPVASGSGGAPTPPSSSGEVGTPGNLNMFGFLTGEDYNPDLDGMQMFTPYQKMRLSDAQVNATLLMLKLPIKAARWVAEPASDDPQDRAIADFVQANLLDDDAMRRTWQSVLDNAMLKFDFGCSAHEIVWDVPEENAAVGLSRRGQVFQMARAAGAWSLDLAATLEADEGPVYAGVADLSPRLPRTFYRWHEDPETGLLRALEQFAPRNGQYQYFVMPINKLVLHTRAREGNNWWGRSVLRTAYPHWFWKQQLYRIDMIGHDRFHVGIPRASLQKEYDAAKAPTDKIEATLKGLRSHDRAYMVQPYGVEFDVYGARESGTGTSHILQSVEHHNLMIARNILQSFAAQGEQRHGSFGAAEVTADVYFNALQGEADEIGAEMKHGVVRRLCDLNFEMGQRGYPRIRCTNLRSVDFKSISGPIKELADGHLITPDDDLEEWLRDIAEAPKMPENLKGRDRSTVPAPGSVVAPPVDAGSAEPPTPVGDDGGEDAEPVTAAKRLETWSERGRLFAREPSAFERQVFDLHKVPAALDRATDTLVASLAAVRDTQLRVLAHRLATKDARPTAAFTDFRAKDAGTIPGVGAIREAIRLHQERIRDFGEQSVRAELHRQASETITAARSTAGTNRRTASSALVTSAEITARKVSDLWRARIIETAIRLRRSGVRGQDLIDQVYDALKDEAASGIQRDAKARMNEAFAIGREAEILQQADAIEKVIYSCLLDAASCKVCEQWDGREMQVGDEAYYESLPPNKDCEGNKGAPDACRCVHLVVAAGAEGARA